MENLSGTSVGISAKAIFVFLILKEMEFFKCCKKKKKKIYIYIYIYRRSKGLSKEVFMSVYTSYGDAYGC